MRILIALFSLSLLLITGCWNRSELDQYSFVQAVALDVDEQENILLTTHVYKPNGGGSEASGGGTQSRGSAINIQTHGVDVFDAIRNITFHLGRKAKWDHMRIILISEDIIKQRNILQTLDFFVRDHEPRPTTYLLVTKGNAGRYLDIKPLIENTLGQQYRLANDTGYKASAKTIKATLLELRIQLKGATQIARLPYLYLDKMNKNEPVITGVALIKKGKMIELIPSEQIYGLLLLTNQLKGGLINVPCENAANEKAQKEVFELNYISSKIKPSIIKNQINVQVKSKLEGTTRELVCSSIKTIKTEKAFEDRVSKVVKNDMQIIIDHLQTKQVDAIGIGNRIFASNPVLWKKWEPDWGEHFANINFTFDIDVEVIHSGTIVGNPSVK